MQINKSIGARLKKLLFTLLFFAPLVSYADRLYMISQQGDYIGQGSTWDFTDATHTFSASQNYDQGVAVNIDGPNWWYLNFAAPGEVPLTPGPYEGAIRFPFQPITMPGLSVSGDGRGCNELSGEFTVYEVQYNLDGSIALFAADFEQHCEHFQPALYGAIRFNSSYPVEVFIPDAVARAGDDQYANEQALVSLDGSGSYTNDGSVITSYYWSQISSPAVVLDDPTSPTPTFTTPNVPLGGAIIEFELEIMTSNGAFVTDPVKVFVSSKSDPQTYISKSSEPGDYVGQGKDYYFTPNHGTFSFSSFGEDDIRVIYNGKENWYYKFSSPAGFGLTPGSYPNAVYDNLKDPTEAGMDIYGAGRACSQYLAGSFDVLELVRTGTGDVESLAIDFVQRCNPDAPALTGSVRYNYVDPSVPTADAGADQAVSAGDAVSLDASGSSDSDGYIDSFQWTQTAGTTVTLSGADTASPDFVTYYLPAGFTEDLVFEVVVTDNLGYLAKDSVTVTVTGVELNYCASSGVDTTWEWIDAVTVNGLTNVTGNNNGYVFYTNQPPITLIKGDNTISLTPGFGYGSYTEHWTVWVDWNRDGEFSNAEKLFRDSSRSTIDGTITIPADAVSGLTRMRISMRYNGKPEACGTFYYGEVEDYTVLIQ